MATRKRKWKLGFNTFWWEGLDQAAKADECVKTIADLGYEAIEFKIDSFGSVTKAKEVVRAAEAARKAGLHVSNLVILRALTNPDTSAKSVADVSNVIDICSKAGIGAVNFATGGPMQLPTAKEDDWWELPQTRIDQVSWDTVIESLKKLADVADKKDVDLALEAVVGNLVCEMSTTLELLARFDHPRLKLTFDPSHFVLAGQDLGVVIRRLGPKIRHVHFKDAVGRQGALGKDFIFPFLGEGATDWKVFLGALSDVGYTETVSIEFEAFRYMNIVLRGDAAEAARISKFAADRIIERYGN